MAFTLNKINKSPVNLHTKAEENTDNIQKITCILDRFIYKDEDSGFFVFSAVLPMGEKDATGIVNGKVFTGRRFVVVGTSLIMTQSIVEKQELDLWGLFEPGKQANSIQFTAKSIQEKIPTNPKAIELFLGSGKIYGIGMATAKKIVTKFGPTTLNILDHNPDMLLEISGISRKKLELIKKSWKEWRSIYEIVATMRIYGVGDSAGVKIFNYFKEKSFDIIKNKPYELTEVPEIGFRTADKIAQQLGKEKNDEQRIEKGILYTLEEISENGHTAFPKDELAFKANELLQINMDSVHKKIKDLIDKEFLIEKEIKLKVFTNKNRTSFNIIKKDGVAHMKMHNTEAKIAKELRRLMTSVNEEARIENENRVAKFIEKNPYKLDESQLKAAQGILSNKVSILTGGPGTGKTHTIKSLLNYFDNSTVDINKNGKKKEVVCVLTAPTGRAAKRMEEATGKKGATMHSLLGYKDGSFVHNEQFKLEGDVFIVDESSMVDLWLLNAFLKALPSHARLIMVGDVDQLESVGAGKVFKDIIESNAVFIARLNVIHRQALNSNIIVASHAIIHREMPPLYDMDSNSDFVFVEENSNEEIEDRIVQIVKGLIKQGENPDNIQILSPKKETNIGVHHLNEVLREYLNPQYHQYSNLQTRFVKGDRVMQYKNNRELNIFNGDIGKVDYVDEENAFLTVKFDDRRVEIEGQSISNLNFSYATTIHKSQGSDYPYVIIPISKSHCFMWDANLLYTAITRGKKKVLLVGDKKTLFSSISSFKQKERITGLKEEILKVFEIQENSLSDKEKEEKKKEEVKPSPFLKWSDRLKVVP